MLTGILKKAASCSTPARLRLHEKKHRSLQDVYTATIWRGTMKLELQTQKISFAGKSALNQKTANSSSVQRKNLSGLENYEYNNFRNRQTLFETF